MIGTQTPLLPQHCRQHMSLIHLIVLQALDIFCISAILCGWCSIDHLCSLLVLLKFYPSFQAQSDAPEVKKPLELKLIILFLLILHTFPSNFFTAFTVLFLLHFPTSPLIPTCPDSKLLWTGTMPHSSSYAQNQIQSLAHNTYEQCRREENNTKGNRWRRNKQYLEFFLAALGTQHWRKHALNEY